MQQEGIFIKLMPLNLMAALIWVYKWRGEERRIRMRKMDRNKVQQAEKSNKNSPPTFLRQYVLHFLVSLKSLIVCQLFTTLRLSTDMPHTLYRLYLWTCEVAVQQVTVMAKADISQSHAQTFMFIGFGWGNYVSSIRRSLPHLTSFLSWKSKGQTEICGTL